MDRWYDLGYRTSEMKKGNDQYGPHPKFTKVLYEPWFYMGDFLDNV